MTWRYTCGSRVDKLSTGGVDSPRITNLSRMQDRTQEERSEIQTECKHLSTTSTVSGGMGLESAIRESKTKRSLTGETPVEYLVRLASPPVPTGDYDVSIRLAAQTYEEAIIAARELYPGRRIVRCVPIY